MKWADRVKKSETCHEFLHCRVVARLSRDDLCRDASVFCNEVFVRVRRPNPQRQKTPRKNQVKPAHLSGRENGALQRPMRPRPD